ncbi:MAG: hypothetical protein ACR2P7_04335 [bacterium]
MNTNSEKLKQQMGDAYEVMMDPEVRRMLRADPAAAVKELESMGVSLLDPDLVGEIKIVTSPKGTMHIPLPRIEENHAMSSDELGQINAGAMQAGSASTVATASTMSTWSTVCSSYSTLSCAGSAGTVGSAD